MQDLVKNNSFEYVKTSIYESALTASEEVATQVSKLIKSKVAENKFAVLGLATGATPIRLYRNLVRMHREEGLSFKNVITFNLDEYYPMDKQAFQSYHHFMNEHLFDHIDINPENIHIPDGTIPLEKVADYCRKYEQKIEEVGGIDLQILGIGRTGHIGFNEPGSSINTGTRLIQLDKVTRKDAASDFFAEEHVPQRAITMGIRNIMQVSKVILMAWGEGKANIIKRSVEGDISESVPATFLQKHPLSEFILDKAGAAELTRIKTPWLTGICEWDDILRKKSVIWLSQTLDKAILKLTNEDYNEYGMSDLVAQQGPAEAINVKVFNLLKDTITGWPGGKPNEDDKRRPERATPFPKRVVLFSPHPDDDVISMGGTFIKLVDQGHQVHVAYQTSGNIAVFDDDVWRFIDFVDDFNHKHSSQKKDTTTIYQKIRSFLEHKKPGQVDIPEVQYIKQLIRKSEAKAACRYCGLGHEQTHFLEMPFYQTGKVKKKDLSEEDIQIIIDLLNKVKPHQIYAAGDLSDPHGTHRVCLDAIFRAIKCLKEQDKLWLQDTYVWLYRGAWQEWSIADIEMAVPIAPSELLRKRTAIFKHQSQKDRPLFPGPDSREFWQRAEQRNRGTAQAYDKLGLAEYEAMEGFVRWVF